MLKSLIPFTAFLLLLQGLADLLNNLGELLAPGQAAGNRPERS
jgi:TRAP-type mannitol/chloroaromatic compound transport system permease small subunit